MKKATAVVIGRFQPSHNGHHHIFKTAFKEASALVILVGSANAHRSIANPFSFQERKDMLEKELTDSPIPVFILPVNDYPYNESAWQFHVQRTVNKVCYEHKLPKNIVLYGHTKDESSYYLKAFGTWKTREVSNYDGINATDIRNEYFREGKINKLLPDAVKVFLQEYEDTEEYQNRVQEFKYIEAYKAQYDGLAYPVIHTTVDAVVHCLGHVLLVVRAGNPGKGQYALPGGFLDEYERIRDGILRELKEETKIDVPPGKLANSLSCIQVFDDPGRSLRGRTLTHAGLIDLSECELPKVKGDSDAAKAEWVSLDKLEYLARKNMIFEDHYHIIRKLLINVENI